MVSAQVSNRSSCIKVAVDFTDPESIATSLLLTQEFQAERAKDVLQLRCMLWHAWRSIPEDLRGKPASVTIKANKVSTSAAVEESDAAMTNNMPANGDSKNKKELDSNRFKYRCPHIACAKNSRVFHFAGVFDHVYVLSLQSLVHNPL